jgi:DNA polymerase-3 subunit alpha
MMGALELAMDAAQKELERRASAQVGLFGAGAGGPTFRLPNTPEWPIGERMKHEKDALGLFITGHPMAGFADECVARLVTASLGEVERLVDEREVKLAGMISACRVIRNKRGEKMAFVTIEDERGSVECVFFSDAYQKAQAILSGDRPIRVTGRVERRNEGISMRADNAERLEDLREREARRLEIKVRADELDPDTISAMSALFTANAGGCETYVSVDSGGEWSASLRIGDQWRVAATPRLVEGLRGLFGRTDAVRIQ